MKFNTESGKCLQNPQITQKNTNAVEEQHSLVFRRKILCDAKPKPVSRKFQYKRSRLPESTKVGEGVIYYAKSEVLDLEHRDTLPCTSPAVGGEC